MSRIGITGHQALPNEALPFVISELRARLTEWGSSNGVVGITSLAAGADQIFANLIIDVGGSLHIVIPSKRYEKTFSNPEDRLRYSSLLDRATKVECLDFQEPSEQAFLAAGRRVVDRCDKLVAIWDGEPARGAGGTGDVVEYARSLNRPVHVIWPTGVTRQE